MHPPRSLLIALLFLLSAPALLLAQAAAPAPAKDPIDAAIDTIWRASKAEGYYTAATGVELDKARRLLVDQRDQSFAKVTALLDNNETEIRLNGAIILAGMAKAGGSSAELLQALKRCVGDTSPAMAYWGAQGIIANAAFPAAERVSAMTQCLKPARPRPLRVAAVLAAGDAKLTPAIPAIVKYLESIQADYRKQVDTALTPKTEGYGQGGMGGGEGMADRAGAPGFTITGRQATPGRVPGAAGGYAAEAGRDPYATGRAAAAPRYAPGVPPDVGGRAGTQPGIGGRAGTQPGMGVPGQPEAPVVVPKLPPIDPGKLTVTEQETVILELEELPTVMELHHIGVALDALVKGGGFPDQKTGFGFDTTPPWALHGCVGKAVKWLADNQAAFAAPATPAPSPAPAAPAPAAPAPATPPATPAPVTPAPPAPAAAAGQ